MIFRPRPCGRPETKKARQEEIPSDGLFLLNVNSFKGEWLSALFYDPYHLVVVSCAWTLQTLFGLHGSAGQSLAVQHWVHLVDVGAARLLHFGEYGGYSRSVPDALLEPEVQ